MGPVTTPPVDEARRIFDQLGYTITGDGDVFSAERKWRSVRVHAVAEPDETPDSGEFRCFVTWQENVSRLRNRILQTDPEYEWAIIGVEDDEEYEVVHAPRVTA